MTAMLICASCGARLDACACDLPTPQAVIPLEQVSQAELERIRRKTLNANTVDGLKRLDADVTGPEDRFESPAPPPPTEDVEGEELDPEIIELMEQEGGFSQ